MLDLSIVIINWNTCNLLKDCINSISEETEGVSYEIIVVDNGSSDHSVEMVKENYSLVKIIANEANAGFTKANNQGFRISTGRFVLMLNSDTVIKDNALKKMLIFADENVSAGIVGCKLRYPNGDFQNSCFRFPDLSSIFLSGTFLPKLFPKNRILNKERYGMCEWSSVHSVDCVMGSCLLIRREVLAAVDYLDENYFMYCEETDLCMKVKRIGFKVLYYPDTYIIHIYGGSQKNWAGLAWSYNAINRGVLLFLTKWHPVFVAPIVNVMLLLFSVPRLFLWGGLDIIDSIKEKREFTSQRLLKFYTYSFHAKALFNITKFKEPWGGRKLK